MCRPLFGAAAFAVLSAFTLAAGLGLPLPGEAVHPEAQSCLDCHGLHATADEKAPRVNDKAYAASVHEDLECIDCHQDLEDTEIPHPKEVEPVDCTFCHDDEDLLGTLEKSVHGRAAKRGMEKAPNCAACHGMHDILSPSEREGLTAVHARCAACHEDTGKRYAESLHGKALARDDSLAPTCITCHQGHGVLSKDDPGSSISIHEIPRLCGSCHKEGAPVQAARDIPHEDVLSNYSQSIHGEGLFKKGLTVTAVCTSCHTSHHVLPPEDPDSTINRANVNTTCTQCHRLIEEVHRKVINGELWEKEPHKIPVCVDCHAPHKARRIYYTQGTADRDCLSCHGKKDLVRKTGEQAIALYVDEEGLRDSVHEGVACAQCHSEAAPSEFRPCSTITHKVDCSVCHEEVVNRYDRSIHGRLHARRDPDAPVCTDCHTPHHVLSKDDARSATFPRNVPDLCGKCHREGEAAARRGKAREHAVVKNYAMSIHGKGLVESGLLVTAVCTDCHTAHFELPASDAESSVNRKNIPKTCSKCHFGIYEQYERSIHATGKSMEKHPLPGCYDCHTSHTIERTDKAGFKMEIIQKCGQCHEDVTETYFETYHGKATRLGSEPAAKCYHCHGAHDVLPPEDPRSRLSRQQILETCRQCHKKAERMFAGYLTHATHHNRHKYPILFYAFWGMTSLLLGTLGIALLHTLLWLGRSIVARRRGEGPPAEKPGEAYILRFTPFQRILHLIMLLSFFGLAITGMSVKFAYTPWAKVIVDALGGVHSAGYLHRCCAVLTFGYFFTHLFHLAVCIKKEGGGSILRRSVTMLPVREDLRDLSGTWKWFFGRSKRPRYGRYTYWEKFDYFAVFWGVAFIGITGLMLWFPEFFTRFIPGRLLNVATIVHSDEALLAVGFIFTVHFFNTHFRPCKFPMDPVIFTGAVPLEEYKWERPREYEELRASGQLEHRLVTAPDPAFRRAAKIFGICALLLGLCMIALILYAEIFAYR